MSSIINVIMKGLKWFVLLRFLSRLGIVARFSHIKKKRDQIVVFLGLIAWKHGNGNIFILSILVSGTAEYSRGRERLG